MKILILTEYFLPMEGGSITWLLNSYSRFSADEVLFVVGSRSGDQDVDRTLPFRVERMPMQMADWDPTVLSSLHRYISIILKSYKICRKHNIQQIHCAKVLLEGLVAWCLKYTASIPYILYAHGEEITVGLTSRKFRWLIPQIYNGAGAVIANSSNTKALLESIGVHSDKIHIIHPGVNADFFNVGAEAGRIIRAEYQLADCPILLTVGRMQKRKGQDMVIKALPNIRKKFPKVKYVIVGTGEELPNLRKIANEQGVADNVIFPGRIPDEDLPAYYAACDVFIMANRQLGADIEGFGMVYLEANAAKKPVIGGISGGTGDAIIDGVTGIRVDGTSVDSIANAVISLLADLEKAKAMGKAGRRRVEKEFTWESIVERTRFISEMVGVG